MRKHRTLIAAIAFALLGLSPIALTSPATADESSVSATAKPERNLQVRGTEPRPNVFFLKGRVKDSNYARRKVVVEKKRGENWTKYKQAKSNNNSAFRIRVDGPGRNTRKVCYRIVIPGGEQFARTNSQRFCIVKL